MSWVATAIIGSAVVGAGAGIYSSSKSSSAVKDASKDATSAELAMFQQSREDQAPWLEEGRNALTSLMGGYGMEKPTREAIENELLAEAGYDTNYQPVYSGLFSSIRNGIVNSIRQKQRAGAAADIRPEVDAAYAEALKNYESSYTNGLLNTGPGDWQDAPEYNFIREQGLRGIERGASAMGGLRSGAHMKAAGEYTSNLANTQINDYYNRWMQTKINPLMQVSGLGQNAAANVGNQGVAAGQSIGQNTLTGGLAQASGTMGAANSITNNLQWGAGQLLDYYNYNKSKNALNDRPGDY